MSPRLEPEDTKFGAGTAEQAALAPAVAAQQVWQFSGCATAGRPVRSHCMPSPSALPRAIMKCLQPEQHVTCRFLLSTNERVQRLKPFASNPVTWFRSPYAQLVLVRA